MNSSVQTKEPVLIELENLSKTFIDRRRGRVEAVKALYMRIEPGELVTLLGPSGCGKTTTLRMISGFETPTTGRIKIGNRYVTNLLANKRDIGLVFQNYALFPHMNVYDNVSYGLKLQPLSRTEVRKAVDEVLELVGLSGLQKRHPNELSGGEQQRVALARVIVLKPQVLLFDEPLSNLDAKRRVQMREEIRKLQQLVGITAVYVTHDQEEALSISDRIVVMSRGVVQQVGTPIEVYARPANRFVAGFVGKINCLSGEVTSINEQAITVSTAQGPITARQPAFTVRQGQMIDLMIRPEAMHLAGAATAAQTNTLHGRIRFRVFLGEKVQYEIDVNGMTLTLGSFAPREEELRSEGEEVLLTLQSDRILAFQNGE